MAGEWKGSKDDGFRFEQQDAFWVVVTMVLNRPGGLLQNEHNSKVGSTCWPHPVQAMPLPLLLHLPSCPHEGCVDFRQDSGGDSRRRGK